MSAIIIVGGGIYGVTAALCLARAQRRTIVSLSRQSDAEEIKGAK